MSCLERQGLFWTDWENGGVVLFQDFWGSSEICRLEKHIMPNSMHKTGIGVSLCQLRK